METQTRSQIIAEPLHEVTEAAVIQWGLAKRAAFRFCFIYLVLMLFPFPLYYIPKTESLFEKYNALWNVIVVWTGKHVLHLSYDITVQPNGSGDTTWNYVQVFCILVFAIAGALIWSLLDRKRPSYPKMYQWLRLLVRFYLVSAFLSYGLAKAIPLQMPSPLLSTLMEPYGESSPMGLLWTFIGASRGYEIFTGLAEVAAGVLLILPRTTAIGAVLGIADMFQVFMLNMCYDVPVKLYSFHLMMMGVFLIAPDLGRLGRLFFGRGQVELVKTPPMFARPRLNKGLLAVQVLFGLYLLGSGLYS
ncbi:MAG TPA: DoxX family protein, partial [Blastocatellia bacterium]|nr:DoxX family protein [Blastocatellia bacterium]